MVKFSSKSVIWLRTTLADFAWIDPMGGPILFLQVGFRVPNVFWTGLIQYLLIDSNLYVSWQGPYGVRDCQRFLGLLRDHSMTSRCDSLHGFHQRASVAIYPLKIRLRYPYGLSCKIDETSRPITRSEWYEFPSISIYCKILITQPQAVTCTIS